jgi:hypothetical protein
MGDGGVDREEQLSNSGFIVYRLEKTEKYQILHFLCHLLLRSKSISLLRFHLEQHHKADGRMSSNRAFQITVQDLFLHGVFATAVGCGKERERCPVKDQRRTLAGLRNGLPRRARDS